MNKFLETYQAVSVFKVKGNDKYSIAFMKGAINAVPIAFVLGSVGYVCETLYNKLKK